jgi:hypothetical protein
VEDLCLIRGVVVTPVLLSWQSTTRKLDSFGGVSHIVTRTELTLGKSECFNEQLRTGRALNLWFRKNFEVEEHA